jgi:hypothetical protein
MLLDQLKISTVWEDEVDNDVEALGERNWKNIPRNRQIWQNPLRKAVAQKGAVLPVMTMMMMIIMILSSNREHSFGRHLNMSHS